MMNFNKVLTSKIISLIVAVSFFLTNFSYAGISQQGSLRVPMGQGSTYQRAERIMNGQIDENIQPREARIVLEYIKRFFGFNGRFNQDMLKQMCKDFQTFPNDKKLKFNREFISILYDREQLNKKLPHRIAIEAGSTKRVITIDGPTILDFSIMFEERPDIEGELAPRGYIVRPGSSGPNAARVIDNLGSEDTIISFYGFTSGLEGDIFKRGLQDELRYVGVEANFFEGKPKTSLFIFTPNPKSPEARPLGFPMRPSNPKLDIAGGEKLIGALQRLPKAEHKEFVVFGGQLFPGLQANEFYPRCIKMLQEKGYRVFVNFQPYMEDDEMMAIVKGSPMAIKPNLKEFSRLAKRYFNLASLDLTTESAIPVIGAMALRIAQENNIDFLIASMDERGAIGAYIDGLKDDGTKKYKVIYIEAPRVKVESIVACGSSLIGAAVRRLILDEYEKGKPNYIEALLEGVAAGSATAEKPGTEVTGAQRFEELLEVMKKAPDGSVHFLEVKPFEPAMQLIEAGTLQNAKETRTGI